MIRNFFNKPTNRHFAVLTNSVPLPANIREMEFAELITAVSPFVFRADLNANTASDKLQATLQKYDTNG